MCIHHYSWGVLMILLAITIHSHTGQGPFALMKELKPIRLKCGLHHLWIVRDKSDDDWDKHRNYNWFHGSGTRSDVSLIFGTCDINKSELESKLKSNKCPGCKTGTINTKRKGMPHHYGCTTYVVSSMKGCLTKISKELYEECRKDVKRKRKRVDEPIDTKRQATLCSLWAAKVLASV